MPQATYDIANQTFPSFRAALNAVLAAIKSGNSGPSPPPTPVAGMVWLDTSGTPILKIRNSANNGWISVLDLQAGTLDPSLLPGLPDLSVFVLKAGDTMTGPLAISSNVSRLTLNSTPSNYRQVVIATNNAIRWAIGADNVAESGSNSGSNFFINRFNDAGLFVDTPFIISRSNGQISFSSSLPIVGPSATPTASNHLSTKGYVDAAISAVLSGRRLTGIYVFNSTQNWTRPDGTTAMLVYAIGGGGGGGSSFFYESGGGGGEGSGGGEGP